MKTKFKKSISGLVFLSLIMCLTFSFGFNPNCIYAENSGPKIVSLYNNTEKSVFDYTDLDGEDEIFVLRIYGFKFQVDDVVKYYINKNGSNQVIYSSSGGRPSSKVIITSENIEKQGENSFNLLNYMGVGEYTINAIVTRGEKNEIVASPSKIKIKINGPLVSGLRLTASYEKVNNSKNPLGTYALVATLYKGTEEVLLDGYEVFWYFGDGESSIPFNNRASFEWQPTSTGSYSLYASVPIGSLDVISSSPVELTITQDNSAIVIYACLGVAGAMTTFVIISTIMSVRKERVW